MISTIGIIGAGTMGRGIAQLAALSHLDVILYDIFPATLKSATEIIRDDFMSGVKKGRYTSTQATGALASIHPRNIFNELGNTDFVIEAAVEDLAIKQDIFKRLDAIVKPDVILATNTSSLSVTTLASATRTPESVIGMHFFNPPVQMKLVEVVRGKETSDDAVRNTCELATRMQKVAVVCNDTPGFIVNRCARPFYGEALRLLGEKVASVKEIDRIVKTGGGFKMGPFALMDLIGIDVNYAVTKSVYEQFNHAPRFAPHPIQEKMVKAGTLGRKTKKGFYSYS
jgi:3-hydroxybutyryl-CoA dehydrogenase